MSERTLSPTVWAIAGHDPFGGAGLHADLRVAEGLGVTMRSLVATLTAQNDQRLSLSQSVGIEVLQSSWNSLSEVESPRAIKLGLIKDPSVFTLLRNKHPETALIYDPVFSSSSGAVFVEPEQIKVWKSELFSQLTLLTPNIPEAEVLLGYRIEQRSDLIRAARDLRAMGPKAVLIKGGHAEGTILYDYFDDGHRPYFLKAEKKGHSFRGTGCTLSSAIACFIARNYDLREAVVLAHSYVQAAIKAAFEQSINHLPSVKHTPELSELFYDTEAQTQFAPMPHRIGFYVVAPDSQWIQRLAKAKVPTLQLRAKDLSGEALDQAIQEAKVACEDHGALFFLNDDWRRAQELRCFGVHLGQEDLDTLSATDLEDLARSGLRLGISTHSFEEAARAKALKPSYIALGPVFETSCKSMRFGPQGIDRVGEWARSLANIPLVAIGGLKREHAEMVLAQGADGIAVISDVTGASDPESRVNEWLNAWQN